ncbi:hypothetical protein [Musicola paradisiaca]|uniref:Uncharacterized protein n=1 Tax=Musicola paradisiaca (strain Ech703) TaxID=579405 RepID=C6CBJ5_MUSP7|nr:hypothetical protein [Musicola paradisiaca]ACS84780.1 conserved hypothetical protein [Musicola paradisiaca Ech703]
MWQTRAIEITSSDLWSWNTIIRVVDYARRHQFNALVLGQADFLDRLVAPDAFKIRTYDDHDSNLQHFNCNYINKVARYCADRRIDLYLQCKEISVTPDLFIRHPELLGRDGSLGADIHFWCQYVADKLSLAMQQLPRLKGVFLAISNTDSLVRFATPSGEEYDLGPSSTACPLDSQDSYSRLYDAVEKVMRMHGKQLVVRLFPASYDDIDPALDSIAHLPANVHASVKITPERFWPEFPNNPALMSLHGRDIWAEFDFAGEEVGWGNLPCLRHEEIAGRMLWCQAGNADIRHILCRITWDGISNNLILDSLSEFSLYVCAHHLSAAPHRQSPRQLLAAWLQARFDWQPDEETLSTLLECFDLARQALCGAIYVKKHVFHRHSMLPTSYGQAVWSLYGQLSRNHWLPGSGRDITFDPAQPALSSENLYRISQEKDEALHTANDGYRKAMALASDNAMPPAFLQRWLQEWRGLPLYCRLFVYAQKAFFTLRYCHQVENNWPLREIARANIQALYALNPELTQFSIVNADYPVSYDHLLDAEKAFQFTESLSAELSALDQQATKAARPH